MKAYRIAFLFVIFLASWAMAQDAAKVESVTIDPPNPKTGDDISVEVSLSETAGRGEVRWYMNDQDMGLALVDNFNKKVDIGGGYKSGDKLKIEVTPFDLAGLAGTPVSKTISFKNAPPEVTIKGQRIRDNTYEAEIEAKDPEGGKVEYSLLESPEGMKIDKTGKITWKMDPEESGNFKIVALAQDDEGQKVQVKLDFSIKRQTKKP